MKTRKTCIVSGGAGFIGSHLSRALLLKGYKVTCLDNLSTGSEKNISSFKNNPDFVFIRADVIDLPEKVRSIQADCIFHLASPASPPQYRRLSIETLLANSQGTHNLLEIAKNHHGRFFAGIDQ